MDTSFGGALVRPNQGSPHRINAQAAHVSRLWTQKETASYLGVSVRYVRASSVPRLLLPGNGSSGKPLVRYDSVAVIAWAVAHRANRRFG
jgi:hypothetical protein